MIVKEASILLFVSLLTVSVSDVSKTTLLPAINSRDEPWGIGAFFNNLTSSDDVKLLKNAPIPQGSSLEFMAGNKVVLETSDTLTVNSDTNNSIDASLTIMEIT